MCRISIRDGRKTTTLTGSGKAAQGKSIKEGAGSSPPIACLNSKMGNHYAGRTRERKFGEGKQRYLREAAGHLGRLRGRGKRVEKNRHEENWAILWSVPDKKTRGGSMKSQGSKDHPCHRPGQTNHQGKALM